MSAVITYFIHETKSDRPFLKLAGEARPVRLTCQLNKVQHELQVWDQEEAGQGLEECQVVLMIVDFKDPNAFTEVMEGLKTVRARSPQTIPVWIAVNVIDRAPNLCMLDFENYANQQGVSCFKFSGSDTSYARRLKELLVNILQSNLPRLVKPAPPKIMPEVVSEPKAQKPLTQDELDEALRDCRNWDTFRNIIPLLEQGANPFAYPSHLAYLALETRDTMDFAVEILSYCQEKGVVLRLNDDLAHKTLLKELARHPQVNLTLFNKLIELNFPYTIDDFLGPDCRNPDILQIMLQELSRRLSVSERRFQPRAEFLKGTEEEPPIKRHASSPSSGLN